MGPSSQLQPVVPFFPCIFFWGGRLPKLNQPEDRMPIHFVPRGKSGHLSLRASWLAGRALGLRRKRGLLAFRAGPSTPNRPGDTQEPYVATGGFRLVGCSAILRCPVACFLLSNLSGVPIPVNSANRTQIACRSLFCPMEIHWASEFCWQTSFFWGGGFLSRGREGLFIELDVHKRSGNNWLASTRLQAPEEAHPPWFLWCSTNHDVLDVRFPMVKVTPLVG